MAADQVEEFVGDAVLAEFVHYQGEVGCQLVGVVGGVTHCDHTGGLLAGDAFQEGVIDLHFHELGQ